MKNKVFPKKTFPTSYKSCAKAKKIHYASRSITAAGLEKNRSNLHLRTLLHISLPSYWLSPK